MRTPVFRFFIVFLLLSNNHGVAGGNGSRQCGQHIDFGANVSILDEYITNYTFQIVHFSSFLGTPTDIATGRTSVHVKTGHTDQRQQQYVRVRVTHEHDFVSDPRPSLPAGLGLMINHGEENFQTFYPSYIYEAGKTRYSFRFDRGVNSETEISNNSIPFWLLLAIKHETFIDSYLQRGNNTLFDLYTRAAMPTSVKVKEHCLLPSDLLTENTPYTCHKIKALSPGHTLLPLFISPHFTWKLVVTNVLNADGQQVRVLRGIILFFGQYRVTWAVTGTEQVYAAGSNPSAPVSVHHADAPSGVQSAGPVEQIPCITPAAQLSSYSNLDRYSRSSSENFPRSSGSSLAVQPDTSDESMLYQAGPYHFYPQQ